MAAIARKWSALVCDGGAVVSMKRSKSVSARGRVLRAREARPRCGNQHAPRPLEGGPLIVGLCCDAKRRLPSTVADRSFLLRLLLIV
jgi:hypothetical protein